MSSSTDNQSNAISDNRAGLFRRIGAWVYDLLIITAIMLLATLIGLGFVQILIQFNIVQLPPSIEPSEFLRNHILFKIYLIVCYCSFYLYFWRKGGQTAGMKTWRLQVRSVDGNKLTVLQCLIRLLTALGGLSNLFVLLPFCNKRGLQDICAQCECIVLSKEENKHTNWKGY